MHYKIYFLGFVTFVSRIEINNFVFGVIILGSFQNKENEKKNILWKNFLRLFMVDFWMITAEFDISLQVVHSRLTNKSIKLIWATVD